MINQYLNISFTPIYLIQHMIWQIVIISFIIVLYQYIYKPRKKYNWYAQQFQNQGFKVLKFKYHFIGAQIFKEFQKSFNKYGDSLYSFKRYQQYDIILCNIFTQPWIIILNPHLIKEFFEIDKVQVYHKSISFNGIIKNIIGNGVVFSEDAQWKKKRKVLIEVFNFDFLKTRIPLIINKVDSALQAMEKDQHKLQINLISYITNCFGQVIASLFFGTEIDFNKQDKNISYMLAQLMKEGRQLTQTPLNLIFGPNIMKFIFLKRIRKLKNKLADYHNKVNEIIKSKKRNVIDSFDKVQKDVLSAIINHNKICTKEDQYSEQDIISQFNNLFTAGIETSSRFVQMMISYMSIYPSIKQKALQQIDKFIKNQQDFTYENLKNLKYLENIQKETLRYFGPGIGTLMRQVVQDHQLSHVPILKGTLINGGFVPNCYNQKYFKNPFQFDPDRWCNTHDSKQIDPYVIINFAAGPRSCIGKQLALLESRIFVVRFLRKYPSFQLKNKQLKMKNNFSYRALDNIVILKDK